MSTGEDACATLFSLLLTMDQQIRLAYGRQGEWLLKHNVSCLDSG